VLLHYFNVTIHTVTKQRISTVMSPSVKGKGEYHPKVNVQGQNTKRGEGVTEYSSENDQASSFALVEFVQRYRLLFRMSRE